MSETRRWLSEIVGAAFDGSEIHEAASMRAGIAQTAARDYDVALIDLGLPDGSGLDVLRNLRLIRPETVCVVTTVMGDDASIVGALSAGAQGYLLKEQPQDLLVRQLKQMAEGMRAALAISGRKGSETVNTVTLAFSGLAMVGIADRQLPVHSRLDGNGPHRGGMLTGGN